MPKQTYVGPHASGVVIVPSNDGERRVPFRRGEPIDFTPDEAKNLPTDEWKAPTTKAAQAAPTPEED